MTLPLRKEPPRFDSFHFGLHVCAWCAGEVRGPARISHVLPEPLTVSFGARSRWIPSGRQSFHPECYESVLEQSRQGGSA